MQQYDNLGHAYIMSLGFPVTWGLSPCLLSTYEVLGSGRKQKSHTSAGWQDPFGDLKLRFLWTNVLPQNFLPCLLARPVW